MKFNCGPTRAEKRAAKQEWHNWFAWFPVRVGDRDCRWFETVKRKGHYYALYCDEYWKYEYKEIEK
jgi:hypothetical protein